MTTFSLMSNPDIMLSIKAYTGLKKSLESQVKKEPSDTYKGVIVAEIIRLKEMILALIAEWEKRGNP